MLTAKSYSDKRAILYWNCEATVKVKLVQSHYMLGDENVMSWAVAKPNEATRKHWIWRNWTITTTIMIKRNLLFVNVMHSRTPFSHCVTFFCWSRWSEQVWLLLLCFWHFCYCTTGEKRPTFISIKNYWPFFRAEDGLLLNERASKWSKYAMSTHISHWCLFEN